MLYVFLVLIVTGFWLIFEKKEKKSKLIPFIELQINLICFQISIFI